MQDELEPRLVRAEPQTSGTRGGLRLTPMNDNWDSIADWYTALVRDGSPIHQFAHDILLSVMPPDLSGLDVLDLGCGEGLITRAVAVRGAVAVGVDPTLALIEHAEASERAQPVGATYRRDDGATLSSVQSATIDLGLPRDFH